MTTTVQFTKVAFYDFFTEEFYIGDDGFMNPIFGSFEKAKLYVGDRMELLNILYSVNLRSNRDLVGLDVKVQHEVNTSELSDEEIQENTTLKLRNRLKEEFAILNAQAEVDVELMSKKDWKRWKKLKSELV